MHSDALDILIHVSTLHPWCLEKNMCHNIRLLIAWATIASADGKYFSKQSKCFLSISWNQITVQCMLLVFPFMWTSWFGQEGITVFRSRNFGAWITEWPRPTNTELGTGEKLCHCSREEKDLKIPLYERSFHVISGINNTTEFRVLNPEQYPDLTWIS